MTLAALPRRRADEGAALLVAALGCVALAVRPLSYWSTAVVVLVGLAGLAPLAGRRSEERAPPAMWLGVVALGAGAFLAVRILGPDLGVRLTHAGIAVTVIASVAEEVFFRRFLYGWIEARAGAAAAIAIAAVLFALVHVPAYGAAAFPIDLAAGGLLGWQRWATGSWTAPAATHTIANLLMLR